MATEAIGEIHSQLNNLKKFIIVRGYMKTGEVSFKLEDAKDLLLKYKKIENPEQIGAGLSNLIFNLTEFSSSIEIFSRCVKIQLQKDFNPGKFLEGSDTDEIVIFQKLDNLVCKAYQALTYIEHAHLLWQISCNFTFTLDHNATAIGIPKTTYSRVALGESPELYSHLLDAFFTHVTTATNETLEAFELSYDLVHCSGGVLSTDARSLVSSLKSVAHVAQVLLDDYPTWMDDEPALHILWNFYKNLSCFESLNCSNPVCDVEKDIFASTYQNIQLMDNAVLGHLTTSLSEMQKALKFAELMSFWIHESLSSTLNVSCKLNYSAPESFVTPSPASELETHNVKHMMDTIEGALENLNSSRQVWYKLTGCVREEVCAHARRLLNTMIENAAETLSIYKNFTITHKIHLPLLSGTIGNLESLLQNAQEHLYDVNFVCSCEEFGESPSNYYETEYDRSLIEESENFLKVALMFVNEVARFVINFEL